MLRELLANEGARARPILLAGGAVVTMDAGIGDWEKADVLIGGSVIVAVGPGLSTAADDDDMIVIDCEGRLILPARVDFSNPATAGTLTPAATADIAVVSVADPKDAPPGPVPARGGHLDILIREGKVLQWDGNALGKAPDAATTVEGLADDHPYLGLWVDDNNFVRQELLPGGRYDEARGDRPSAYQGAYWIRGERIIYLDDLGFWAFGEFKYGLLHHAGYRFTRR